jgi:hypothetical protein
MPANSAGFPRLLSNYLFSNNLRFCGCGPGGFGFVARRWLFLNQEAIFVSGLIIA